MTDQFKQAIINQIQDITWNYGDIGDIGNEIGIAIGEVLVANKVDIEDSVEDFISGVKHGVSLVDGTHK